IRTFGLDGGGAPRDGRATNGAPHVLVSRVERPACGGLVCGGRDRQRQRGVACRPPPGPTPAPRWHDGHEVQEVARMLSRRTRVRTGTRVRSGLAVLALVSLLTLSLSFGAARPAHAVVGDCVPGTNWGTLDTSFAAQVLTLVNQHRTSMG